MVGVEQPGLILLGLAMMGGGIATTAGGLKLLRVYALARHGERETGPSGAPQFHRRRRAMPSGACAKAGPMWRGFFSCFTPLPLPSSLRRCRLRGLEFEQSLVLTVAAVTTTGPLGGLGQRRADSHD